jgi:hypothetical protein
LIPNPSFKFQTNIPILAVYLGKATVLLAKAAMLFTWKAALGPLDTKAALPKGEDLEYLYQDRKEALSRRPLNRQHVLRGTERELQSQVGTVIFPEQNHHREN